MAASKRLLTTDSGKDFGIIACTGELTLMTLSPSNLAFSNFLLWSNSKKLNVLVTRTNSYVDVHESRCRTIEPSKREGQVRRARVKAIYSPQRVHGALMFKAEIPGFHYMFVMLRPTHKEAYHNVPEIMLGTGSTSAVVVRQQEVPPNHLFSPMRVASRDTKVDQDVLGSRGEVVENGPHGTAVFIRDPFPDDITEGFLVATYIEANYFP